MAWDRSPPLNLPPGIPTTDESGSCRLQRASSAVVAFALRKGINKCVGVAFSGHSILVPAAGG